MAFFGGEYLVTGTATSIASALSITDTGRFHYKQVVLRNNPSAVNDAFVGPSTVTTITNRAGILRATDAGNYDIGEGGGQCLDIRTIFLVGTANAANIIFISLIA